ncbi:polyphosphate:AMP phosphotransferase [Acidaminococcus sp. NSJ-142]|uniref:polyphosphate:AMP phosphotransferase n=1 Tax=Acidaminococcus TaxID=904 RepID=UPI000CFA3902|nr:MULTISPECIES: polyphosphate:AMP phosphotransferase [Acidaminococcus]MCD2435474.1 polyphosphate:AMP phosphotransferase [Acidaminococcus hominis]MCH4095253.1 polyphosphate:AMP phosphotransferase [Acidaminococcus provencensis]
MLDKIDLDTKISKKEYTDKMEEETNRLGFLQRSLRDAGVPVIILFEGFRGTFRSELISKVISALDPRGFRVFSASKTTDAQKESPFFTQFWNELPAKGHIAIHHRAWYFLCNEHLVGDPDEAASWYNVSYEEINTFEKELTDGGYTIIKIFTHISKKQQKENLEKGPSDSSLWEKLTPSGIEGIDYNAYREVYEKMLAATDTSVAPWHIIPMEDKKTGTEAVFQVLIACMEKALRQSQLKVQRDIAPVKDPSVPDILATFDPNQPMDSDEYDKKLKKCHKRLGELQVELAKRKISTIIAFEGQDAGGKGGAIKRLSESFDPLGYQVNPVSAPNEWENQFHYLWRFWTKIPRPGEIAIFDRTWYGRVLVERIEHFATNPEWRRAYGEIQDMEAQWVKQGIIVQKFWMHIDQDEQLKRFQDRENDPNKTWKITPDDWRNRSKWDAYVDAVNEMIYRTDTPEAPWTVVEANNKLYARIKVLETVIARMEAALAKAGQKA